MALPKNASQFEILWELEYIKPIITSSLPEKKLQMYTHMELQVITQNHIFQTVLMMPKCSNIGSNIPHWYQPYAYSECKLASSSDENALNRSSSIT